MFFRKYAWRKGLTRTNKIELSDVIEEVFRVASKNIPRTGPNTEYIIRFYSPKTHFTFDDQCLFEQFNLADKVKIAYKEVYKVTYDYEWPDFWSKKEEKRELQDYEFLRFEKLNSDCSHNPD